MMLFALAWSVYALVDNYTADKEEEWDEGLDGHFIISGTICAHGEDGAPDPKQAWLNCGCAWFLLVVHVLLFFRAKQIVRKIDDSVISPSDFNLFITRIPLNT
jgi:hypothetical protein